MSDLKRNCGILLIIFLSSCTDSIPLNFRRAPNTSNASDQTLGLSYNGATEIDLTARVASTHCFNDCQQMLNIPRSAHTATLLNDGRVLVVGGAINDNNGLITDSVEIYNPDTNSWSLAAPLNEARHQHRANLLSDGRVLVSGGYDDRGNVTESVEIYNPINNTWTVAANLAHPRVDHSATLLADGRVLVVAGFNGAARTNSAEIFDPDTNTWTVATSSFAARYAHSATLIADGTVLVAGGTDGGGAYTNHCEIYDPVANSWSAVSVLAVGRAYHQAILLADGRVLVAGGVVAGGNASDSVEIYDPNSGTWSVAASLNQARAGHEASLLEDGRVIFLGGFDESFLPVSKIEIYDPLTNTMSDFSLSLERGGVFFQSLVPLADGKLLIAGDWNSGVVFYEINPGIGFDSVSLTLDISGGEAPYTYQLLSGAAELSGNIGNILTSNQATTAVVRVRDAQNATLDITIRVQ